jgi:hypothetical protein
MILGICGYFYLVVLYGIFGIILIKQKKYWSYPYLTMVSYLSSYLTLSLAAFVIHSSSLVQILVLDAGHSGRAV